MTATSERHTGSGFVGVLDRTERHLELQKLRGWDPYDALCSPLFSLPVLRSNRLVRFGAQQTLKRSPWNLRPLLRIDRQLNPVSIGLYLQGQAHRARSNPRSAPERLENARLAVERLVATSSPGYSGICWGYPFDWEARYASIPANTPTVVATGIVTNALWTAYDVFGLEIARELILDAVKFVLQDLNRVDSSDEAFCWSYSPVDRQAVLNATLKGSRLLAQAHALGASSELLESAARSVRFVLSHQKPSGAWPYSANDARTWADNFHTGYVLECLNAYRIHSGDHSVDLPLEKGWRYYRDRFFASDLTPKYYDNRSDPLDATACAQAIITLCALGNPDRAAIAAQRSISALALPDGSFAYQRRRGRTRRIPFLRWSTAWMYSALSTLEAVRAPTSSQAALQARGEG